MLSQHGCVFDRFRLFSVESLDLLSAESVTVNGADLHALGSLGQSQHAVGQDVGLAAGLVADAGQLVKIICTEAPSLYVTGTVELAPTYDPLTGKGTLVLSSTDADAYRYYVEETVVAITGSGSVILTNDYMPVVPVVKTTAETALAWQVGSDSFRKSVSAGTWEFPELELAYGDNTISITGSGTTTFTYREGRL